MSGIEYLTVDEIHSQLKDKNTRDLSWLTDWAANGAGKYLDGIGWVVPKKWAERAIGVWNA